MNCCCCWFPVVSVQLLLAFLCWLFWFASQSPACNSLSLVSESDYSFYSAISQFQSLQCFLIGVRPLQLSFLLWFFSEMCQVWKTYFFPFSFYLIVLKTQFFKNVKAPKIFKLVPCIITSIINSLVIKSPWHFSQFYCGVFFTTLLNKPLFFFSSV